MKRQQGTEGKFSNLTELLESYNGCRELLRESRLKAGAEVEGRESKLLFLRNFVYEGLAKKWFVLKDMEADDEQFGFDFKG